MSKSLIVVTGSGSGIGLAIAHRLVLAGHHVFGVGRSTAKLLQAQSELKSENFSFVSADLSTPQGCEAATLGAQAAAKKFNLPISGLVNNAGIYERAMFRETSDLVWESQFQNNLMSSVRLTRGLYQDLKAAAVDLKRTTSIVNISSSVTNRVVIETAAYTALKSAMNSWTKVLALEAAPDQIRVNAVCPGLTDTPIHGFHGKDESDPTRKEFHKIQPLGRMGLATEVAEASVFLLLETSAWTTGSILTVDGGVCL